MLAASTDMPSLVGLTACSDTASAGGITAAGPSGCSAAAAAVCEGMWIRSGLAGSAVELLGCGRAGDDAADGTGCTGI